MVLIRPGEYSISEQISLPHGVAGHFSVTKLYSQGRSNDPELLDFPTFNIFRQVQIDWIN